MNVLVLFERSGVVREAFRARGHNAWSLDRWHADDYSDYHYQMDYHRFVDDPCFTIGWDLVIAHPPCTYLSSSGLHWNKRRPERKFETEAALNLVLNVMNFPAPKLCVENPIGCISTRIRKPDQYIQPYEFGEDASKRTCLWLKHLPPLVPTKFIDPRMVNGRPRWSNQTDSGQNRLGPSDSRSQLRSKTYKGIAEAMAEQWS